jgi:EAL domain-containing protein (putative c-di-GMP-specific phosphodiesterase class I)
MNSRAKVTDNEDYVFFKHAFRDDLQSRLQLEGELYLAVERGEFELYYQPQINLQDGKLVGAEALIRWRHPLRGLLAPGAFMPVVNTSPISEPVANWVMKTAFEQCRAWQQAGHPIRVAINLSPSQLQAGDGLVTSVTEVLARVECPAHLIELEVTEDILLMNDAPAIEGFRRLQQMGVKIAFDDFGTGYASMSHLKNFPLDTLKIDKSFVIDLWKDTQNVPIVNLIISLCRSLGLTVVAEGVEDERTAAQLATMGCTEGQGYFYSRPVPAAEFEQKFFRGKAIGKAASAA